MKIKDYLYLSNIDLKKDHKFIVKNVLLIVILLVILIFSLVANDSINNVYERNIKYNVSFRTIYVANNKDTEDDFIKNLQNIKHVQKVIDQKSYSVGVNITNIDNKNGNIYLMGSNSDIAPIIINGRTFESNERNVCIIPKKFYIDYIDNKLEEEKFIDGEQLLGDTINISYNKYDYSTEIPTIIGNETKSFQVIGIYDHEQNLGNSNECYVSYEDVYKISHSILENSNFDNGVAPLMVIVDNSENIEGVLKELHRFEYDTQLRSEVNTTLISIINVISLILSICIMILVISNIIINSIKTSKDKKREIGLLKTLGYKNRQIWNIIIFKSVSISFVCFFISSIISVVIFITLNLIISKSNLELQQLRLIINPIIFLYAFILSISITLIGDIISNIKLVKNSVISNSKI